MPEALGEPRRGDIDWAELTDDTPPPSFRVAGRRAPMCEVWIEEQHVSLARQVTLFYEVVLGRFALKPRNVLRLFIRVLRHAFVTV